MFSHEDRTLLEQIASKSKPSLFGFTRSDIVKIIGFLIALSAFYYRTTFTLEAITGSLREISKTQSYLAKFATNSDSYHSAVTGSQFDQGKPVNPSYDFRRPHNTVSGGMA